MDNTTDVIESSEALVPAITWLNMSGDVTITWDEGNQEVVRELVKEKMAQGYSFFILKPRKLKVLGNKKVALTHISQLENAKGVVVPDSVVTSLVDRLGDAEVESVVKSGKAHMAQAPRSASLDTTRRARTADEVVNSQAVAVRPIVGG